MVMFLSLHPMDFTSLNSFVFSRASSYVSNFNTRNKLLTQNFLNKAIGIINIAKPFLNFIDDTMS